MSSEDKNKPKISPDEAIRKTDTRLARWWARNKIWHKPNMGERYFGVVSNELACIPEPISEKFDIKQEDMTLHDQAVQTPEQTVKGQIEQTIEQQRKGLWEKAVILEEYLRVRLQRRLMLHMSDVFSLELMVLRLLPDDRLLAKAWSIRADFKQLVPDETFKQYEASNPPSISRLAEPAYINRVREDAVDLLTAKHWWYINSNYREKRIQSVKNKLFGLLLAFLSTMLWQLSRLMGSQAFPALWLMLSIVTLTGMTGAILSISRRILPVSSQDITESDPVIKATQFDHGWIGILLSIGAGGVSALVLYLLMNAGLSKVAGDLMPMFFSLCPSEMCCKPASNNPFVSLMPVDTANLAKALCWSFVAGFAEKFVPDILDRMAKNDKVVAK